MTQATRFRSIMIGVINGGIYVQINDGPRQGKYHAVRQASIDRLIATIPSDPRVNVAHSTIWMHWDMWTFPPADPFEGYSGPSAMTDDERELGEDETALLLGYSPDQL